MGTKHWTKAATILLIGAALALGACTRSASTPPPSAGETEGTPSGLSAQQATMEAVRAELLTQTAQASTGEEDATSEATETPEPTDVVEVTSAPTSAATGPPAATQATGGVPSTYTLQEGEHPFCIARRFDIDPTQLLNANGLDTDSVISPGMTLTIPQTTSGFPGERVLYDHPDTYTVASADTIYGIACYYGDVYPQAIAQANGLTEPYDLTPGSVLNIP
ncbi:MAG: LysM peptidoglycan-binding domain-containing protein [Anaerolineales bacterium]